MSDQEHVRPQDKTTTEIAEGVSIKLTPEEKAAIDAIREENSQTIALILALGRKLTEQELSQWDRIHEFYPEIEYHQAEYNWLTGVIQVQQRLDNIEDYSRMPQPFSLRQSPDGLGFVTRGRPDIGSILGELLRGG